MYAKYSTFCGTMFSIKQCFVALSVHKYFHKLHRKLRFINWPFEINIFTCYRLVFLLAMILQYYIFMKYFEIRNLSIVLRTTPPDLDVDLIAQDKFQAAFFKLKRSYFRRRQKWRVPKNTSGVLLGRDFVFHHGDSVYAMNLGPENVSRERRNLKWLERNIPEIKLGGFYAPKNCRSIHKIAILVPYKNRPKSLVIFLNNLHRILRKQLVQYRVFLVEQYGSTKQFNKGSLYNIAYIESQKFGEWHCLVFHDVDLLLQDSRNLYTCSKSPIHLSPSVESQKYKLPYPELVGGVTAMTPAHYALINGYSNSYWDWGGEDDDLYIRFTENNLQIHRANNTTGIYAHTKHKRNRINIFRYIDLDRAKKRHKKDGLNSVAYKLVNIKKRKLFTHILADVNPYNFTI